MSKLWDIPPSPELKIGDAAENTLYEAVGRALSKWERVVADLTFLFAVLTSQDEPWTYNPAVRAIGAVPGAGAKSEMVQAAAEALFHNFEHQLFVDCEEYRNELKTLLLEFNGWTSRRNDVAHGCVAMRYTPGKTVEGEPIHSTYFLLPSNGASKKWPTGSLAKYQYRADEIDKFGTAFDELGERVHSFAKRLEQWRIETINRNPL